MLGLRIRGSSGHSSHPALGNNALDAMGPVIAALCTFREEMAATYEDPEEVVNWYYSNQEQLSSVESKVLEDQVVEKLLASANIVENECTYQEALSQSQEQADA